MEQQQPLKLYEYMKWYLATGKIRSLKIPGLRLLIEVLACHNIIKGAFPSYEKISQETALSNRDISKGIKELLDNGIIRIEKQPVSKKGFGYVRNVYRLIAPEGEV